MTIQPVYVMKKSLGKSATSSVKRDLLTMRDRMLDVVVNYRLMTGQLGPLPSFIIIGAQKGGTTYLYDELIKHPHIAPALTKEVHFFDANYSKGLDWYRGFFVTQLQAARRQPGQQIIAGEASPSYIYHPHTLKRILAAVPQAKLIMLLRNPASRAYSHYHHEVRLGFEKLSFEEALQREEQRLDGEYEKLMHDEYYDGYNYMHYSYLRRGMYIDQVKAWKEACAQDQLLIIKSEDFYRNTPAVMAQVTRFLGLPPWTPVFGKPEANAYPKMDAKVRASLAAYFKPHNQRLYDYLGINFGWDD